MKLASILLLTIASHFLQVGAISAAENEKYSKPVLIRFDSDISYRSYQFFKRKLAMAKAYGADLLVIEINSPGGLLEESLQIAESLRDVNWAHTVAYIPEKALSGAALASLGCDQIIIGENGRIGDAGIIFMDTGFAFHYAPEKMISDLVSRARSLAEKKGRPPEIAESMIDMDTVVYRNRKDKTIYETRRAVNSGYPNRPKPAVDAVKKPLDDKDWELIEESGEGRFLVVTGNRALELGLAEKIANSREELAQIFDLPDGFKVYDETTVDALIYWLNTPLVTGLLFIIGLVAIYLEFSAPGIGVGALIAGLCFAIFFWSHFLGGTAGVLEVILFLSGIVFLIMEIFVIPGFGVAGIAGLILIVASVLMATQDFVIPQNPFQTEQLQTNLLMVCSSGAVFLISAYVLSRYVGYIPVVSSLMLSPPKLTDEDDDGEGKKGPTGNHPIVSVGDWGTAESVLRPAGKARFGDRTVDVVADGSFIEENQQVKVIDITGNRVLVVKA